MKKTINGREIEYNECIYFTTTTKFKFLDRLKVFLGKEVIIKSEIYLKEEGVTVMGSESRTIVSPFMRIKSKGKGFCCGEDTKNSEDYKNEVVEKGVCPNHSSMLEFLDCDICRNKKVFNYGEITMDQLEEAANYIYNKKVDPDKRVMILSQYCKTIGGPVKREGSFEYYYCDDEECKGCSIIRKAVEKYIKK